MRLTDKNAQTMLRIFTAVEERDEDTMSELCHPDVQFFWPPCLSFGGEARGLTREGPSWEGTWTPLQPTDTERRMDPRIVAASDIEVVVQWTQKGLSASGERLEQPVLGLYSLRDGKLARAQMFYFDAAAVAEFLARTTNPSAPRAKGVPPP